MLKQKTIAMMFFLSLISSTAIAGYTNVIHKFDVVSQALSEDLEASYEMFFLINTKEGPTQIGAFIPNQHMLVLKKAPGEKLAFKRDKRGLITGLASQTQQLSEIIPNTIPKHSPYEVGMPFDWDGLEVLPISSGTLYHMATFSGVFQLNWDRSKSMYTSDESQPMSHSLYVGYYYHDMNLPPEQWTDDTREKISYVALHGTPNENWPLLGRVRASHGCARVRAPIMKAIYNAVDRLPFKKVIELDWDYELPQIQENHVYSQQKPVLFLIFDGY